MTKVAASKEKVDVYVVVFFFQVDALHPFRRGFERPRRGLADISVSENHVRSSVLHKVILALEDFEKSL